MKNRYNNLFIKKIGAAVILTAVIFSAPSCKKFTDLEPKGALPSGTAFDSPANIELDAVGVYYDAANGNYSGTGDPRGYPFGAAAIEQSEMRGQDMINTQGFWTITYQTQINPTTANNVNMWNSLYELINQANTFIDGVHTALGKGVITAPVAQAYEGEARFLRAIAHHELVINFCRPYLDGAGSMPGIPYRTIPINTQAGVAQGVAQDRGTVAQDYTALLADLDYAETNLPETNSANSVTRATKGAAIALKTRIKQHMGDWAGVITEGAKLGATGAGPYTSPIGGYKLTASPDGPFVDNQNNGESIFSIEQSKTAAPSTNGALASMFEPPTAAGGGRALACTSPNLYNASYWVSSDTRRKLLQVQGLTDTTSEYFFNNKYRDVNTFTDYAPVIRYAEVLLNVAEAYARTNSLTNALNLLNAVRNRAVAATDSYTGASFTSSLTMTQAILNERRIEFAGEGRRWADITRLVKDPDFSAQVTGIPAKILIVQLNHNGKDYNLVTRPMINPSFAAIPYSDFRFIWPFPLTETNTNPTLAKDANPGYGN